MYRNIIVMYLQGVEYAYDLCGQVLHILQPFILN